MRGLREFLFRFRPVQGCLIRQCGGAAAAGLDRADGGRAGVRGLEVGDCGCDGLLSGVIRFHARKIHGADEARYGVFPHFNKLRAVKAGPRRLR